MVFCVWILGTSLDFRKAKNTRLAARVFLRFAQVSQHPRCLDQSIQTRKTIWYFFSPKALLVVNNEKRVFYFHYTEVSGIGHTREHI